MESPLDQPKGGRRNDFVFVSVHASHGAHTLFQDLKKPSHLQPSNMPMTTPLQALENRLKHIAVDENVGIRHANGCLLRLGFAVDTAVHKSPLYQLGDFPLQEAKRTWKTRDSHINFVVTVMTDLAAPAVAGPSALAAADEAAPAVAGQLALFVDGQPALVVAAPKVAAKRLAIRNTMASELTPKVTKREPKGDKAAAEEGYQGSEGDIGKAFKHT